MRGVPTAVLLTCHGTVDRIEDLPAFLANIRRGRPTPPAIVARGDAPLPAHRRLAADADDGRRRPPRSSAASACRCGSPGGSGAPTPPRSSPSSSARASRRSSRSPSPRSRSTSTTPPCARRPPPTPASSSACAPLVGARARARRRVRRGRRRGARPLPRGRARARAGDPHGAQPPAAGHRRGRPVRARVPRDGRRGRASAWPRGATRCASPSRARAWTAAPGSGPDLPATFAALAAGGARAAVVAPIGFVADHVETLYDLDVEAPAPGARRPGSRGSSARRR